MRQLRFKSGNSLAYTLTKETKNQVATVMIATARIAVEHGSFNCIGQVAPICAPSTGPYWVRASLFPVTDTDRHTNRASQDMRGNSAHLALLAHVPACAVTDPRGRGIQSVRTPAVLIRCLF